MARSEFAERPPLTVALLATPDSTASTLFGLYDLLLGTRRDWQQLMHRCDVASPFRPLIVSRDGGLLRVYNDIPVQPHASLTEAPPADVVIVSNLAVSPWEPLNERYAPEAQWLRGRGDAGCGLLGGDAAGADRAAGRLRRHLALGLLRLPAPRVSGRALASGQGAGQYRHRPSAW